MAESPSEFMLSMFHQAGIHFESVEEAWQRAEHLYPLLGWLTARFPDASAFQTCAEWLKLCASHIEGSEPAAALFAQAQVRSEASPRQAHVVAGGLGDIRNERILAGQPAAAAFADAASDLCEVWAAVTTHEEDAETNPWARAKAASAAMVTAWLYQQGLPEQDKAAKTAARIELTGLLRSARTTVLQRET